MASSLFRTRRFHVFPSFHGPDVRRGVLSHLHYHFASKGILMFKDQEIERGHTIGPELKQAIRESRVSIVVLSKNYASSTWCLEELVEILKCKEDEMQIMITVFYDVDPSDVRKQKGNFGRAFERTCEGKTEEKKQRWSKALAYVATIAGEHSLNWDDESAMVEKIVADVSNKLNVTLSRDFDDIVGLQAHLRKLDSLLCLECDEVKMIGIWGPAGIGKSTIARALYNLLSNEFRLRCFMGNLRGIYKSILGVDDYDSKLGLQNQLLSKIFNQKDMRVHHLGAIKEWLQDQRVLIILDDVDDLEQLEVLAKEISWFGCGSRIIIITKDRNILKAHGINEIYHVDFPSKKEALEILCLSAFKQSSVRDGFEELANKVANLCGDLPLALCVVGSSLRGESKHEWELQLSKIETTLDGKIEDVLRVGYDRLLKKDQSLFLHIACFFNKNPVDRVTTMLADSNLDVENGLKTLAVKSLVQMGYDYNIATQEWLTIHCLLQQLGRQVVYEQSDEPGKRQFLLEAEEIRNVLANETGTGSVIGISFDMSKISEFSISGRAFEGMRNLRFLKFYNGKFSLLHILGDMTYLPRLRSLQWSSFPGKRLPPTFQPECLIELHMESSNLEKLWRGIQPLANLKEMNLSHSFKLKEIPDLSNATSLHTLKLEGCTSLVELPSSFRNLHKLKYLYLGDCSELRVIPTNINLASLKRVDMSGCSRLRSFPDFSNKIEFLNLGNTKIEDVPASIARSYLRLGILFIGSRNLKRVTHIPECVTCLILSGSDIERIPDCVIGLPFLSQLIIENCRKLVSLPILPRSLWRLNADDCGSLKSASYLFYEQIASSTFINDSFYHCHREFTFRNCLKLDEEARKVIIQRWAYKCVLLPGQEVPAEFTHKAKGNFVNISSGTLSASSCFKACLLISPTLQIQLGDCIRCFLRCKGVLINELTFYECSRPRYPQLPHLLVFSGWLFKNHRCNEVDDATTSEIQFEFSCKENDKIIECGVQILSSSSSKWKEHSDEVGLVSLAKDESIVESSKHTNWWSWLRKFGPKWKKTAKLSTKFVTRIGFLLIDSFVYLLSNLGTMLELWFKI